MGKNLYSSIVPFFKKNIFQLKNKVLSATEVPNINYYIYKIKRSNGLSDFKVIFSDAYLFTENDYYELFAENIIERGDFILIARPESRYVDSLLETTYRNGLFIGKTSFLVRFLNNGIDNIRNYILQEIQQIKNKKG